MMNRLTLVVLGPLFVVAGFGFAQAAGQDLKGSSDHPLVSRMPNFHITEYKAAEYDSYPFFDRDKKRVSIEGRKWTIRYTLDKGATEPGELKIRRNYQDALKKIGGEVINDENFNRFTTIVLKKDGKESWIEVRCYSGSTYQLAIVQKEIMEQAVEANAEAMGNDITATGHAAIYGIYFDTGKAEIKPESDAAIAEMAKLLKGNAALKLFVVGHTDNVGSLDANMKLSRDRAEAVTRMLVSKHGIGAERLSAYGVGSLAPVASNKSDEGRAKNRRVELVER
jgi:outer membrane protein OmpA-like peptidoglycan-associated protein